MRLIGRDLIHTFVRKHPDARSSLRGWAQFIEANSFQHFVELKEAFRSADYVRPYTVFNISGNKYRLVALLNYALQTVEVRHVLTHEEYDEGGWMAR